MILLKRRQFGDIFSDTFQFLRDNAKHYFLNYFTINGIPILVFMLLNYFFSSYTYNLGTLTNSHANDMFAFESSISLMILMLIVGLVVGVIQYTYTPIYFILYQENGGANFGSQDIFNAIFKKYLGKIVIFFLAILLISIPIALLAGIASIILLITIVGWLMPFVMLNQWYSMAFIDYLSSDKSVFTAIGDMFNYMFVKFWNHAGALFLLTLMVLFVFYAFALVIGMVAGVGATGLIGGQVQPEFFTAISIISMFVNQVLGAFIQAVTQIANMIVYFSIKEEQENISGLDEIDKIGLSE